MAWAGAPATCVEGDETAGQVRHGLTCRPDLSWERGRAAGATASTRGGRQVPAPRRLCAELGIDSSAPASPARASDPAAAFVARVMGPSRRCSGSAAHLS